MSSASINWTRPPSSLAQRLMQWWQGIEQEINHVLSTFAQEMAAHAQATHLWQNITGAAEAGLHGTSEKSGSHYRLTLAHGASYGIWLEVRWGGKYAVILPTIEAYYGEVMAALQELIG